MVYSGGTDRICRRGPGVRLSASRKALSRAPSSSR